MAFANEKLNLLSIIALAKRRTFEMMKLLLLLAVIALASDAIMNDGGFTKAAWSELSKYSLELVGPEQKDGPANPPRDAGKP